ncbi:MAG: hypothetical protein O9264_02565 [Leptospira sp.]|nr:hypothetical protein [Leptospira sp.]
MEKDHIDLFDEQVHAIFFIDAVGCIPLCEELDSAPTLELLDIS